MRAWIGVLDGQFFGGTLYGTCAIGIVSEPYDATPLSAQSRHGRNPASALKQTISALVKDAILLPP